MAVRQQFILDAIGVQVTDEGTDERGDYTTLLVKSREAAEALYADLGEALGQGSYVTAKVLQGADVPVQQAQATEPANEEMLEQMRAEMEAFFAPEIEESEPTPITPVRTEEQMSDAEAAATQALSRRELQRQDPENQQAFTPHVATTVPPNQKRGSAIGAVHLNQDPPQAY